MSDPPRKHSQLVRRSVSQPYQTEPATPDSLSPLPVVDALTGELVDGPSQQAALALPAPVLVVEDDPLVARSVRRHLTRKDLAVTLACRPAELVALKQTFALGVFDIDLPEQNGVELAQMCLERGIVERVVFYSAATDQRLRRAAEGLGDFIPKGAGIEALVERVVRGYRPVEHSSRLIAVG